MADIVRAQVHLHHELREKKEKGVQLVSIGLMKLKDARSQTTDLQTQLLELQPILQTKRNELAVFPSDCKNG